MSLKYISNPKNPWAGVHTQWLGEPPEVEAEVFEERAKSILSENNSPDLGFRFSLNPYRGCFHACAYCYARPTHQYWDFGAGTDFDRKLTVKINAPELLEKRFMKKSWQGEPIMFSGITDCYQPLEASYELTKRCLEVCARFRNPVGIVTKGALIQRDLDVLKDLARNAALTVYMSVAFSDDAMARKLEPNVPLPSTRLKTMQVLHEAGIEVGVALAPIIPGLNDHPLAEVLKAAAASGARRAFMTLLRLPSEVKPVFLERLQAAFSPSRVRKVTHGILEMRDGKFYQSGFGKRMSGEGERWRAVEQLFTVSCKRLGINFIEERDIIQDMALSKTARTTFKRPEPQLPLFEDLE